MTKSLEALLVAIVVVAADVVVVVVVDAVADEDNFEQLTI